MSVKYYVYILRDPRDGKPFYVGKGRHRRMGQHVLDAESGNGAKAAKIREITEAGRGIEYTVDSEWVMEQAAFDRERELIKTTPGLTNIVHNNTKPLVWDTHSLFFNALLESGKARKYYAEKYLQIFSKERCKKHDLLWQWESCEHMALNATPEMA
ncbi:hypothetical protein [Caudoviricetes sp.]|nr:hypothetical protein [Caudoviricetes sp.]